MTKRALTAIALLATLTGSANAQNGKAQDDADLKEIHSYVLTMPALEKLVAATKAVATQMQNDPRYKAYTAKEKELKALQKKEERTDADDERIEKLQQELEAMNQSDDQKVSNDASLTEMAQAYDKIPGMKAALGSVGLTSREYAKFSLCALEAGMVAAMQKNGIAMKLPEGVQPANVQFMKDHEKDFVALQTAMGSK